MAATTNFVAAQAANRRNTLLLLVVLTALAALFGYVIGWVLEGQVTDTVAIVSYTGLVAAAILAAASIVWSGISLAFGDRMVLSMADAKPIDKADAPQLFNVVEEMSIAAGVPMPKVMVMEVDALNAFATGTSTSNSAIVVTRGLLKTLNREELQGVIGHEMGHIANLDTRYMTIVGVTVGLIALVSSMILRAMQWGSYRSSSSSSSDRKGSGGGSAFLIIVLLVVAVLAPLAAKAVQMAVSRQREYLADATSVQFTRNPDGLISALKKLEAAAGKPFPGVSDATQHLFIVNPMREMTAKTSALMATHPDIESRIERLRNLGA
jgi:heat shock protein HtpX